MMPMPRSCAARGLGMSTSRPSMRISPSSFWYTPASTFMRVDLPAPFSPIRACTSPATRSNRQSSRARTPGKVLLRCSMETSGVTDCLPIIQLIWRVAAPSASRDGLIMKRDVWAAKYTTVEAMSSTRAAPLPLCASGSEWQRREQAHPGDVTAAAQRQSNAIDIEELQRPGFGCDDAQRKLEFFPYAVVGAGELREAQAIEIIVVDRRESNGDFLAEQSPSGRNRNVQSRCQITEGLVRSAARAIAGRSQ